MIFRGKNIKDYTADDIQSLIENKVPESKLLDYKRELQFDEKSKVEFIYDVSSFYNTDGGCIIVGLDEEKDAENKGLGIPKMPEKVIAIENYDNMLLRIQDSVRQSTNPSITNLQFSPLISLNGSNVFLIGIPKTKSLPAMVTYGNHNRFFKRKANGKYFLDTYELYETFNEINLLEKRIKSFIQDRQIKVSEDIFWPDLGRLSSILIHCVPVGFFDSQIENFATYEFQNLMKRSFAPPGHESFSTRYCFEGFHLFKNRRFSVDGELIPYNLLFRNGSTETFTNEPFYQPPSGSLIASGEKIIEILKEQLEKMLNLYKALSIDSAFYLSIKLNNVHKMYLTPRVIDLGKYHNFNELQLPITLVQQNQTEVKEQAKNMLDILWQSVGSNECPANEFKKIFDKFSIS